MIPLAILDCETTGMAPPRDRIIEVAAVIIRDGHIVDTFSELLDPGCRIPSFITSLTGISTAMVRGRPSPEVVLPRLRAFLGDLPVLAHNASFDRRFIEAECMRAQVPPIRDLLCSVLLARRLVAEAPSRSLGPLAAHLGIPAPPGHRAHRALDDVQITAEVWRHLYQRCHACLGDRQLDLAGWQRLQRVPAAQVPRWLSEQGGGAGADPSSRAADSVPHAWGR